MQGAGVGNYGIVDSSIASIVLARSRGHWLWR